MQTLTINGVRIGVVGVPKGFISRGFHFFDGNVRLSFSYYGGMDSRILYSDTFENFNKSTPKILSTLSNLTEEQCKGLVSEVTFGDYKGYPNYEASGRDYRDIIESSLPTAKESFTSYLRSKGVLAKSMVEKLDLDSDRYRTAFNSLDIKKYESHLAEYNSLPDDLLILIINQIN